MLCISFTYALSPALHRDITFCFCFKKYQHLCSRCVIKWPKTEGNTIFGGRFKVGFDVMTPTPTHTHTHILENLCRRHCLCHRSLDPPWVFERCIVFHSVCQYQLEPSVCLRYTSKWSPCRLHSAPVIQLMSAGSIYRFHPWFHTWTDCDNL